MMSRRITAYFIDLIIYSGVVLLSIYLGELIANSIAENVFLKILIVVPLFVIFQFVTSGLLGVLFRGSIGKKFMDLKIVSTAGFVTAFRLMFRDLMKYLAYTPFLIGLFMILDNKIDNETFFLTTVKISGALLLLLAIAQAFFFFKQKMMIGDAVFFTKVENDIPTANEYDDLIDYVESKQTVKK